MRARERHVGPIRYRPLYQHPQLFHRHRSAQHRHRHRSPDDAAPLHVETASSLAQEDRRNPSLHAWRIVRSPILPTPTCRRNI